MAIKRMTLDEVRHGLSNRDRAKIKATSEDDIRRHMIEDGEDPDAELREEDIISPWYIRKRLGLSQRQFAILLAIPVATLQNWEQNRVIMEPATRASCPPRTSSPRSLAFHAPASQTAQILRERNFKNLHSQRQSSSTSCNSDTASVWSNY